MTLEIELVRPDDLLNLQIEADNLRLNADDPEYPVLVVANPQQPAYLIVTFPPQSIAETAYFEAALVPNSGQPIHAEADPNRADPDANQMVNEP